jgi:hypothetical protein
LLELVDNTVHTLFLIDYDNNCQHFVNGTGALLSVGVCAFVFSSASHVRDNYYGNNDNLDDCIPVYIAPECKNVVDDAIKLTASTLSNLSHLQHLPSLKRVVVVHGGDKGYLSLEHLNGSDQSCIEVKQVSEHEYIFDDHIFSEYSRLVCSHCLVLDAEHKKRCPGCQQWYCHDSDDACEHERVEFEEYRDMLGRKVLLVVPKCAVSRMSPHARKQASDDCHRRQGHTQCVSHGCEDVYDTPDRIFVHEVLKHRRVGCRECRQTFETLCDFHMHCDDKHHAACVKPDVVHCPESLLTEKMRKFLRELSMTQTT